jgi:hypothetical protein
MESIIKENMFVAQIPPNKKDTKHKKAEILGQTSKQNMKSIKKTAKHSPTLLINSSKNLKRS